MSSDYYAILGVSPAAEDVVIGAAYRALMRHYHPDTNADPAAQDRAREITAAYAVLRDPGNRAAYDAGRAAGLDSAEHDEPRRPPPMRAASIVSAVLALGLVAAVWAWPRPDLPDPGSRPIASKPSHPEAVTTPHKPPTHLEPESERLAKLAASSAPPPEPVALPVEPMPEPLVAVPRPTRRSTDTLASAAIAPPRRKAVPEARRPAPEMPKAIATAPPAAAQSARLATLDRLSAGFFSQSMVHASDDKKQLLLAARDRSAAKRKACRSDSCIADAYLRQIRQTSVIMERPLATPK